METYQEKLQIPNELTLSFHLRMKSFFGGGGFFFSSKYFQDYTMVKHYFPF